MGSVGGGDTAAAGAAELWAGVAAAGLGRVAALLAGGVDGGGVDGGGSYGGGAEGGGAEAVGGEAAGWAAWI